MNSASPETQSSVDMIRSAKEAMRRERAELYRRPWTIENQEQIDRLEIGYYELKIQVIRQLSKKRRATAARLLQSI